MDKEELKQMGQNPDFIKGIYNYCDRWCKRCPLTSKCMVYATEKEDAADPEARDINNEKFWEQAGNSLQLAMELLHDFAEEEGIDLSNIDSEAIEAKERKIRKKAEEHPAAQKARQYSKQVNQWFTSATDDFEGIEEMLLKKLTLGLPEKRIKQESETLRNLIEIIRWYQHQIYVKIIRALQSKYDQFDEESTIQNDANGSAKVALSGIERSMSAFGNLMKFIPGQEDQILPLLVFLEQIKQHLELTFPNMQDFQRPGFDTL